MSWEAYKVFNIQSDTSESTSEKVFSVDREMEKLKINLKGEYSISGFIGPLDSITNYLIHNIEGINKQSETMNKASLTNSMQLQQKELAALFVVETKSPRKRDNNQINLCFVVPNEFYYSKPYNKTSISYMLIRYIGDLCDNITVLYDNQIEKEFSLNDCPYRISSNALTKIRMQKKKVGDVKLGDVQVKCDMSQLQQFDKKYLQCTKLDEPMPVKALIHRQKLDRTQFRKKAEIALHDTQKIIWKVVFEDENRYPLRVLNAIDRSDVYGEKDIIDKVIKMYEKLKQKIFDFAAKCLSRCANHDVLPTKVFKQESYFLCIKQYTVFSPSERALQLTDKKLFFQGMAAKVSAELGGSRNRQQDISQFCQEVSKQWKITQGILSETVVQFCQTTNLLLNKMELENQSIIELNRFHFSGAYDREGDIQHITLEKNYPITLTSSVLKSKYSLPALQLITDINLWQLSHQSQLLWLQFKIADINPYSGALLSVKGSSFTLINRYKKPNAKFTFSPKTQKGYLLDLDRCNLTHFYVHSSIGKIYNQETIAYVKQSKSQSNSEKVKKTNQIISFGITTNPHERLFFLTKEKNVLYSFNISSKDQGQKYKQYCLQDGKQGIPENYTYLKLFNEDIFVVLGTHSFIDVAELTQKGGIRVQKRIKFDSKIFMGASVFTDKHNEYLIIHKIEETKAYVFYNMNKDHVLEMEENNRVMLGNPILDIFYEAYEKFGAYRTYSAGHDTIGFKKPALHHISTIQSSIKQYVSLLELDGYEHRYYTPQTYKSIFTQLNRQTTNFKSFTIELKTRIPIQICSLKNNNIISMIEDKKTNNLYRKMTATEKCLTLDFGIIEQLLMEEQNRGVFVVSVMGAQSSGKSYLMNRIFGTRFAVAVSRTTVGIWFSLVKAEELNFLILDCEGLFSQDRTDEEEEKLIKILAGLSDLTILNQNMGINSKGIIELFEKISGSASNSFESINVGNKSNCLFQGSLMTVVRDTGKDKAKQITKEFYRSFQTNERKQANGYLMKLFGGQIRIFCIASYRNTHFGKDVAQLWKNILTMAKKRNQQAIQSPQKPLRKSEQVLNTLKMMIAKLSDDNNSQFMDDLKEFNITTKTKEVIALWLKSPDITKVTGSFIGKNFKFANSEVKLSKLQDTSAVSFFLSQFYNRILIKQKITTLKFNTIYTELNQYLIEFFKVRERFVDDKLAFLLQMIPQQSKKKVVADISSRITESKNDLRLCLQKCSDKQCKLLCIKEVSHLKKAKRQKQIKENKIKRLKNNLQLNQLTQQQQKWQKKGIQTVKKQVNNDIRELSKKKADIQKLISTKKEVQDLILSVGKLKTDIQMLQKQIDCKAKVAFINTLRAVDWTVQKVKHLLPQKSYLAPQKIEKLITQNEGNKYETAKEIAKQIQRYKTMLDQLFNIKQQFPKRIDKLTQQFSSAKQNQQTKQQKCRQITEQINALVINIRQLQRRQRDIQKLLAQKQTVLQQKQKIQAQISTMKVRNEQSMHQLSVVESQYHLKVQQCSHQQKLIAGFDEIDSSIELYRKIVRSVKETDLHFQYPLFKLIRAVSKVQKQAPIESIIKALNKKIEVQQKKIKKIINPVNLRELKASVDKQKLYKAQCQIGLFLNQSQIKVIFEVSVFHFVSGNAENIGQQQSIQMQIAEFLSTEKYGNPQTSEYIFDQQHAEFDELIQQKERCLNDEEQKIIEADEQQMEQIQANLKGIESQILQLQLAKKFWQSRKPSAISNTHQQLQQLAVQKLKHSVTGNSRKLYLRLQNWNPNIFPFFVNLLTNIQKFSEIDYIHQNTERIITEITSHSLEDLTEQKMIRIIYKPLLDIKKTELNKKLSHLQLQLQLIMSKKTKLNHQMSLQTKFYESLLISLQSVIEKAQSLNSQCQSINSLISMENNQKQSITGFKTCIKQLQKSLQELNVKKLITEQQLSELSLSCSKKQAQIKQMKQEEQRIGIETMNQFETKIDGLRQEMNANCDIQQIIMAKSNEKQQQNRKITQHQRSINQMRNVDESQDNKIESLLQNSAYFAQQIDDLKEKMINNTKYSDEIAGIQAEIIEIDNDAEGKCSCGTNHKCDQVCEAGCKNQMCLKKAGHQGSHTCGNHSRGKDH